MIGKENEMLIALDYDGTYTLDPDFWNEFIKMVISKGHKIICATMRYDNQLESSDVLNSLGKSCQVIFTGRNAKKEFLANINIYPDVWIDDNPMWLYTDG